MKNLPILVTFLLSSILLSGQSFNDELKVELDSIMALDQAGRILLMEGQTMTDERKAHLLKTINKTEEEFFGNPWGFIMTQDEKNRESIIKILDEFGYPGKTMVGDETSKAAWYVIQHSDPETMGKYLPMIKEAGEKGELHQAYVATMEDRYLMHSGKPQIYGSQSFGYTVKDAETGEDINELVIWPIKNPELVNERRKDLGFKLTIEEYARQLNIEYEVLTIEEAKALQAKSSKLIIKK